MAVAVGLAGTGRADFQGYALEGSSFLDGASTHWEQARDVAFDSQGNLIVVGGTSASNFPTTAGAYDRTYNNGPGAPGLGNAGGTDVFVVKISPQGQLLWSTFIGGPNYDRAYAVEVGPGDDVFIAGRAGAGFPATPGVLQGTFAGDVAPNSLYGIQDGFVARLSADGGTLRWATYFGESGPGFVRDIALDGQGNVYVAGTAFRSGQPAVPVQAGPQPNVSGGYDSYYGKISSDGAQLLFGTFIGGPDTGAYYSGNPSIRVTPAGDVYFMAWDPAGGVGCITPNAYQTTNRGGSDIVLARFAPDNALVFCTYYGGSDDEELETHTLAVDAVGAAVIGGFTLSTDLPVTPGAVQPSAPGLGNGFLAVISPDGRNLVAATYIGGNARDEVEGLAVASDGDIVFGGNTASPNLPVTANALDASLSGPVDGLVGRVSGNLGQFKYLGYMGGSGADSFRTMMVDPSGNVAYAGHTDSGNFPMLNAFDGTLNTDPGSIQQGAVYARLTASSSAPSDPPPARPNNLRTR